MTEHQGKNYFNTVQYLKYNVLYHNKNLIKL